VGRAVREDGRVLGNVTVRIWSGRERSSHKHAVACPGVPGRRSRPLAPERGWQLSCTRLAPNTSTVSPIAAGLSQERARHVSQSCAAMCGAGRHPQKKVRGRRRSGGSAEVAQRGATRSAV
jgi:hypothetical protein